MPAKNVVDRARRLALATTSSERKRTISRCASSRRRLRQPPRWKARPLTPASAARRTPAPRPLRRTQATRSKRLRERPSAASAPSAATRQPPRLTWPPTRPSLPRFLHPDRRRARAVRGPPALPAPSYLRFLLGRGSLTRETYTKNKHSSTGSKYVVFQTE